MEWPAVGSIGWLTDVPALTLRLNGLQPGDIYEKLPFDKSEIITNVGTKLFTRIKNGDQQRVIREFLLEQPASDDR